MTLHAKGQTLVIQGGRPLRGDVTVGGSKNATLGAMAACLLVTDDCILENVPEIDDVEQMALVLRSLGATVEWAEPHTLRINGAGVNKTCPDRELVGSLRGSFLVMGALLGRFGEASCPPPGGDVIGQRPIEVHLEGFRRLGAETGIEADTFHARAKELRGSAFFADYPSVLGTQNTIMAATLARGTTTIINAASEPEVQSLAEMLNQMGARISGRGTHTVRIEGVEKLQPVRCRIIPDRLEAGTFAIAGAITDGEAELLTQARGISYVHERVFDNRLLYIGELRKMGAEIVTTGATVAIISGPAPLTGSSLRALDVRAGAAFVLAGLAAAGRTEVSDIYHVDRGYERIDEKLRALGADIERA
jgi:UDP-N-acetylglucosamine 1-carboxyvinyltransferase